MKSALKSMVRACPRDYVENIGDSDLVFLEMFRAHEFTDCSLYNWFRRVPPESTAAPLNLDASEIRRIPPDKEVSLAG
jgi:oxalate decarboxylase